MEWVFRDYGIPLKQAKDPLPHRDNVMELDEQNKIKKLEKNIKLQGFPRKLQEKVKEVVTEYWDVFSKDGFR